MGRTLRKTKFARILLVITIYRFADSSMIVPPKLKICEIMREVSAQQQVAFVYANINLGPFCAFTCLP
jgi:hypothetical protein